MLGLLNIKIKYTNIITLNVNIRYKQVLNVKMQILYATVGSTWSAICSDVTIMLHYGYAWSVLIEGLRVCSNKLPHLLNVERTSKCQLNAVYECPTFTICTSLPLTNSPVALWDSKASIVCALQNLTGCTRSSGCSLSTVKSDVLLVI